MGLANLWKNYKVLIVMVPGLGLIHWGWHHMRDTIPRPRPQEEVPEPGIVTYLSSRAARGTSPPSTAGGTSPPPAAGGTSSPSGAGGSSPPSAEGGSSPPSVAGGSSPPPAAGGTSPPPAAGGPGQ